MAGDRWGARIELRSGPTPGTTRLIVDGQDLSAVTEKIHISCDVGDAPRATITLFCGELIVDRAMLLWIEAQAEKDTLVRIVEEPEKVRL